MSDKKDDSIDKQPVLFGWLSSRLDKLISITQLQLTEIKNMATQLETLTAQVRANTQVEASAILLIQTLADKITQLLDNPAALAQLAADLKVSADALSAAIVANTPAQ